MSKIFVEYAKQQGKYRIAEEKDDGTRKSHGLYTYQENAVYMAAKLVDERGAQR